MHDDRWNATVTLVMAVLMSGFIGTVAGSVWAGEQGNFREWVAATSGWAAAGAAVITFVVLLAQLKQLRRQSDFICGDLGADVTWAQSQKSCALGLWNNAVLYVTNLDRRAIRLLQLKLSSDDPSLIFGAYLEESEHTDTPLSPIDQEEPHGRIFDLRETNVEGWLNRNNSAERAAIRLWLGRLDRKDAQITGSERFQAEVIYRLLGSEVEERSLKVDVDVSRFLHRSSY